ncbi:PhoPQ-regulated protein [Salmonella enterica subsp. enterica serovar Typhimurium]|nr:PhoPQ-regulated protein [Salmonella enterica subsp. enterica serovar Typhimurium]EKJ4963375.1 PhoPQ-regulated protein [Salmonella enterica subsp. enterica serovar Typhimurium]
MKIRTLYMAMLFISPAGLALSAGENNKNIDLTHVISDYRISLTSLPLDYSLLEKKQRPGVMLQRFNLNSQTWSPQGVVSPERWQNGVDIYIPDSAREKNALVVINNGSNNNGSGTPVAPTNFNEEELSRYQDASLHIPMAASVSQAFRLAKKELTQQNINKFIVTGASKRGWAAWLTALSDPDVGAVVPFAMDLLNTQKSLEHMYQSYGKNWPVAFYPYYNQGIDQQVGTDKFARLMRLEDPLTYLNTDMGDRLKIDKYIINASGDDFYVPDNSHFYYGLLPGSKSLRVVPNSTHNGILSVAEQSLITFVNRFQEKQKLPEITENVQSRGDGKKELVVNFSEKPVAILQWTARNPAARDFRYACDIKYNSVPVSLATGDNTLSISLTTPDSGWQATYIEATFTDGYVATTQVYITPDEKYPETAPPSIDASCQTLPGRGLSPTPVKQ